MLVLAGDVQCDSFASLTTAPMYKNHLIIPTMLLSASLDKVNILYKFVPKRSGGMDDCIMINCILAGVGGQGTVLASKLIAGTAIRLGQNARTAETIGMAQRGGCVVSHVRIAKDEEIFSPMVPLHCADLLIGFEPAEALRCIDYMKPDGVMVVSKKAIMPITASLSGIGYDGQKVVEELEARVKRLVLFDADILEANGLPLKSLNVALLGAAVNANTLNFTMQDIEQTIKFKLNEKFHEMNLKALSLGARGE